MTTTTIQARFGGRHTRAAALCLLALASVLCQSREARAQWTTSGTSTTTTDSVGIGTTAPAAPLEIRVNAGDAFSRFSNAGNQAGALDVRYKYESSQHRLGLSDGNGQWMFYTQFAGSNANSFGFFPGRVGIGTESPAAGLDVNGAANIWSGARSAVPAGRMAPGSLTIGSISASFGGGSDWNPNTAGLMLETVDNTEIAVHDSNERIASFMYYEGGATNRMTIGRSMGWGTIGTVSINGNVGVGTAAPGVRLAVNGAGTNVYKTDAWIENNMHIQGNETISQGGGRGRMRLGSAWGYVGLYAEASSAGAANDLVLGAGSGTVRVGPGGGIGQSLIVPNGRIGVGTSAPAVALDVNGDIRVSGNINAKYQDVAEWVPSKQKLSAGTVVVLDTGHSNHVLASKSAYDTRVAGVISAQPGLSLGEAGEGKVLVATTGRVKVRVDASRAPVMIGDLIVTSDVAGVAMRSEPVSVGGVSLHRPGTLIGKALESLEKGTGEILVLLSLQ
jgi:hypothetical protein